MASPEEERKYEARVNLSLTIAEIVKLLVVDGDDEAVDAKLKAMSKGQFDAYVFVTGMLVGAWRKVEAERTPG
jgi:hypothetical protein